MSKRVQRRVGDIVEVSLGDGVRVFGRVLRKPLVEFFSICARDSSRVGVDVLMQTPVAFRIWVMNDAVSSGRWPVVDYWPVEAHDDLRIEYFFKQDVATLALTRYWTDPVTLEAHEEPISFDEATQLENAAVWSAAHVEERLRAMCAGEPSKIVAVLRPRAS